MRYPCDSKEDEVYEKGFEEGFVEGLDHGRSRERYHVIDELNARIDGLKQFSDWPAALDGAGALRSIVNWLKEANK